MNFRPFRHQDCIDPSDPAWLSSKAGLRRDEDDAVDREWARHRALLWATVPNRWGVKMTIEKARFESLAWTNRSRQTFHLPPLEPPL